MPEIKQINFLRDHPAAAFPVEWVISVDPDGYVSYVRF